MASEILEASVPCVDSLNQTDNVNDEETSDADAETEGSYIDLYGCIAIIIHVASYSTLIKLHF